MPEKIKKLLMVTGLVGASACATYSAVRLVKSIRELDSAVATADYNDLRKEVRHYSEMIEMLRLGLKI